VSLDELKLRTREWLEPSGGSTPEVLYERQWALMLLDQAMQKLRLEHFAAGKGALLEKLQIYLSGDAKKIPYGEIAGGLGMSANAVKVAVHRLRKRYGELVRQEVAQTVASPGEIDDEVRHLIAVLGRS
jgi:hypothetical protein